MSVLEIGIVLFFAFLTGLFIYIIFSDKGKKSKEPKEKKEKPKKEKKEDKTVVKVDKEGLISKSLGDKKIEPAVKKGTDTAEIIQKEEEAELEKVLQKEPPKPASEPFRVIRKQSQVKINKQALKSGSRNPSITRVFDKGVRIDLPEESSGGLVEDAGREISKVVKEIEEKSSSINTGNTSVGHYGVREPNFDFVDGDIEFKMNVPTGLPNRTPIIKDRTNFASHLTVSDDNNLSGVVGTGVAKIIEKAESLSDNIDKKTDEMVRNVKKDILGDIPRFGGLFDYSSHSEPVVQKRSAQDKLKKIDAETLILADAIKKRKGK